MPPPASLSGRNQYAPVFDNQIIGYLGRIVKPAKTAGFNVAS